jgi:hypothetical protein
MNNFECFFERHLGETCLIIGNGPSLRGVPNSFLKRYPSFGSNRIYLKYLPTYYVAVNPLVIEQNKADIRMLRSTAKFVREGMGVFDPEDTMHMSPIYELHSMRIPMFSFNPCAYVYEGFTVTFVAMELAFFMGFKTVLLVGVDHRYIFDGVPNEQNVWQGDDPNHFDENYFKGMQWHNPDLANSEVAYALAKEVFDKNGVQCINLTAGSALDVFEKGSIEQWLK